MSDHKIKLLFLALISMALMGTCNLADYTGKKVLPGAANLLGEYEGSAFGGIMNETWRRGASGSLIQVGYYIEEGDTLVSQTIIIERIIDKVYLVAIVNERPPLIFEGILVTDDNVTFENKTYTNPYRIEYTFLENGYHRVTTGTEDGEKIVNRFHLIRK